MSAEVTRIFTWMLRQCYPNIYLWVLALLRLLLVPLLWHFEECLCHIMIFPAELSYRNAAVSRVVYWGMFMLHWWFPAAEWSDRNAAVSFVAYWGISIYCIYDRLLMNVIHECCCLFDSIVKKVFAKLSSFAAGPLHMNVAVSLVSY